MPREKASDIKRVWRLEGAEQHTNNTSNQRRTTTRRFSAKF
jgi:hypothetical protein